MWSRQIPVAGNQSLQTNGGIRSLAQLPGQRNERGGALKRS
jgi:hypothetical protein